MTDDPTQKSTPASTTETPISPSTATPVPDSAIGDPVRRGYGDKTDDESQRTDHSKGNHWRFEDESEEDGGEGHKGPSPDSATREKKA
jgi:hypothetical protein